MKQKNYLIIGGTGGIGQAMVQALLQRQHLANEQSDTDTAHTKIYATYHKSQPDFIDGCER